MLQDNNKWNINIFFFEFHLNLMNFYIYNDASIKILKYGKLNKKKKET